MKPFAIRGSQTLLILFLPLLLVLGSVRLLITDPYLAFEYGKASFPEDPFGFDRSQRLTYAGASFRYVREAQPAGALANQTMDNRPLYNSRELKHMQDVQNVYQAVWKVWQIVLGLSLLAGAALAWRPQTRPALFKALKAGGLLAAGLVAVVGVLAVLAWQAWFVLFHQVFFAPGTWSFNTYDTLIRLFPEKFWFDAALTISGLTVATGLLVAVVGGAGLRRGQSGEKKDVIRKRASNQAL